MRVVSRIALLVLLLVSAPAAFADHFLAECQLTLSGTNPPASQFYLSPHGLFRSGTQMYQLRGQTLTTYNITALGDVQVAREDFLGSLAAREVTGGVTFSNGFLYVSSDAGLEIYDLRNVRAGGTAPVLVSRTPGLHYRRLAVSGTMLAALEPSTDLPCRANGSPSCYNAVDFFNVANPAAPSRMGSLTSIGSLMLGFNDITFNYGYLYVTGIGGTWALDVSNVNAPRTVSLYPYPGNYFTSNGTSVLGIGNDQSIEIFTVTTNSLLTPYAIYNLPALTTGRSNPLVFDDHPYLDDANGRLITLVNELDPQTLRPARTIAFDIFDFTVPELEGSDPRLYEAVSYTTVDEVKYNPVVAGPYVYVIGEQSGMQTYGACGQVTGKIELDANTAAFSCGGSEIHGWVTGTQKISNVELFLDNTSLGAAALSGPPRIDIPSRTPVTTFRVNVNLDATARGEHQLRAVGTDANGDRRQFAAMRIFFNGPGQNCTLRRRTSGK